MNREMSEMSLGGRRMKAEGCVFIRERAHRSTPTHPLEGLRFGGTLCWQPVMRRFRTYPSTLATRRVKRRPNIPSLIHPLLRSSP